MEFILCQLGTICSVHVISRPHAVFNVLYAKTGTLVLAFEVFCLLEAHIFLDDLHRDFSQAFFTLGTPGSQFEDGEVAAGVLQNCRFGWRARDCQVGSRSSHDQRCCHDFSVICRTA